MKARKGWPEMCSCPVSIFNGHTTIISFIRDRLGCRVGFKMAGKSLNGIWVRKGRRRRCIKESTINKILMVGVSKPLSNGR
jgi:hypothetical protein